MVPSYPRYLVAYFLDLGIFKIRRRSVTICELVTAPEKSRTVSIHSPPGMNEIQSRFSRNAIENGDLSKNLVRDICHGKRRSGGVFTPPVCCREKTCCFLNSVQRGGVLSFVGGGVFFFCLGGCVCLLYVRVCFLLSEEVCHLLSEGVCYSFVRGGILSSVREGVFYLSYERVCLSFVRGGVLFFSRECVIF